MAHCSRYLRETTQSSPLLRHARDLTSQGGEDGILEELFRRLPMPTDGLPRSCIEVGSWDGKWLSNTYSLCALQGWRGLLIEADAHRSGQAAAMYDALGRLRGQVQTQVRGVEAEAKAQVVGGVVCMTALVTIHDATMPPATATTTLGTGTSSQQSPSSGPCNVCGVPGPIGETCHGWEIGEFHVGAYGAETPASVPAPVPTANSLANKEAYGSPSQAVTGPGCAAASLPTLLALANQQYPQHIPLKPDLLSIGMYANDSARALSPTLHTNRARPLTP